MLRSLADGCAVGLSACALRMFMLKKFVAWPFFPAFVLTSIYRQQDLFFFYNKKFFDMCNVGEQYDIGRKRNEVLRVCNQILDREDF